MNLSAAVHGYLSGEDLIKLYGQVKAAVTPLLSSAGVKGKVNQAMKYGTPVIATPSAVEDMFATDGIDCMIARSPAEFVRKVAQVYRNCALWNRLVEGGLANLEAYFSYKTAVPAIKNVLVNAGVPPMNWRNTTCSTVVQATCWPWPQEAVKILTGLQASVKQQLQVIDFDVTERVVCYQLPLHYLIQESNIIWVVLELWSSLLLQALWQ